MTTAQLITGIPAALVLMGVFWLLMAYLSLTNRWRVIAVIVALAILWSLREERPVQRSRGAADHPPASSLGTASPPVRQQPVPLT